MKWEKCICKRCKGEWWPRNPEIKPKFCAKCNSPYWNKERTRGVKTDA